MAGFKFVRHPAQFTTSAHVEVVVYEVDAAVVLAKLNQMNVPFGVPHMSPLLRTELSLWNNQLDGSAAHDPSAASSEKMHGMAFEKAREFVENEIAKFGRPGAPAEEKPVGQERAKLSTDLLAESAAALRAAIGGVRAARSDFDEPLTKEEIEGECLMADLETSLLESLRHLTAEITERRHTQIEVEMVAKHGPRGFGEPHSPAANKEADAAHQAVRTEQF